MTSISSGWLCSIMGGGGGGGGNYMTLGLSSHHRSCISKSSVADILSCLVYIYDVIVRKWGLPKSGFLD